LKLRQAEFGTDKEAWLAYFELLPTQNMSRSQIHEMLEEILPSQFVTTLTDADIKMMLNDQDELDVDLQFKMASFILRYSQCPKSIDIANQFYNHAFTRLQELMQTEITYEWVKERVLQEITTFSRPAFVSNL
jgi:hypothetical protein